MAETFKFELVSPERIVLSADVDQVVLPGTEGDFAVLVDHEARVTTLRPGIIDVTLSDGRKKIFVKSGLAQVTAKSTTVLAEHSFVVDAADPRQIEAELAALEKSLAEENDEEALDHLKRAIADIKALH